MIDTQHLEDKIRESGKKKRYLASQCGITPQSFGSKVANRSQFTVDQVAVLCRELNITRLSEKDSIFFAKELNETPTREAGT